MKKGVWCVSSNFWGMQDAACVMWQFFIWGVCKQQSCITWCKSGHACVPSHDEITCWLAHQKSELLCQQALKSLEIHQILLEGRIWVQERVWSTLSKQGTNRMQITSRKFLPFWILLKCFFRKLWRYFLTGAVVGDLDATTGMYNTKCH